MGAPVATSNAPTRCWYAKGKSPLGWTRSCYAVTVAEIEDCSFATGRDACGSPPACTTVSERLERCTGKD